MAGAALGILAGIVHVASYGIYFRKILRNEVLPNTATWILWVFLSALNAASYIVMSQDPLKGTVAVAGAASCTVIFLFSLCKGRFSPVRGFDLITVAVGIISGAAWIAFQSATFANLLLQAGFLLSMVPTYRKVLRDGASEPPLPWFLWSLAYVISTSVVIIRWNGNFPDLAYPVLCMLSHGGVGAIAVINKNKNQKHSVRQ